MQQVQTATTAQPLLFFMTDSADGRTGKTGLAPTVTLSKAGGSFGAASGAVSDVGNGWYKVAGNATDNNTVGPLALHATAAGADPADVLIQVVTHDPFDLSTTVSAANANKIADHVLRRNQATARASSDGDAVQARCLLNAASKLDNKVGIVGTTLTVYAEDDSATAFTQAVTTSGSALPITGADTA